MCKRVLKTNKGRIIKESAFQLTFMILQIMKPYLLRRDLQMSTRLETIKRE